MCDDFELADLVFEIPSAPRTRWVPDPLAPGYRKRAELLISLLLTACTLLGVGACGLTVGGEMRVAVALPLICFCGVFIAIVSFWWVQTRFCPFCGARTRKPWTRKKVARCPGCFNLNDPTQVLFSDAHVLDLSVDAFFCSNDQILQAVGYIVMLAVYDEARELTFELTHRDYRITVTCNDGIFEVEPLPSFVHFGLVQTLKAIGDLNLMECDRAQDSYIEVRVPGRSVCAHVLLVPTEFSQKLTLRFHVTPTSPRDQPPTLVHSRN